jgi:hypothetical protein
VGGAVGGHISCDNDNPPSPALPQRKSGLPDLRKISRDPGGPEARGGGSRPSLPRELIPFQRDARSVRDACWLNLTAQGPNVLRGSLRASPEGCQIKRRES